MNNCREDKSMTDIIRAYCGLLCSDCEAYKATINNDNEMKSSVAEKWSTPEWPLKPEDINCEGCKSNVIMPFMADCSTRNCAKGRNVETCAHCDDYICSILEKHLEMTGEVMRKTLEEIRKKMWDL
jgi:uncharacterized CHY-type Zn-finger protein